MEAPLRLKSTFALLTAAAAGSALVFTGGANAAQVDSATGGGQIMVGSEGGAGDTIAFTAKDDAPDGEEDSGQVQFVDRTGGTGKGGAAQHGRVVCVNVDGNTARIGGVWTSGPAEGENFGLYVQDNGEGDGSDIVALSDFASAECAEEPDDQDWALARGNAQVRDKTP